LFYDDWIDLDVPVKSQGPHRNCWEVSGSENISNIRYLHGVDLDYTPYSSSFLTDFADRQRAKVRHGATCGKHYCYGYSSFKGLQFAMNNGMPRRDDWTSVAQGFSQRP